MSAQIFGVVSAEAPLPPPLPPPMTLLLPPLPLPPPLPPPSPSTAIYLRTASCARRRASGRWCEAPAERRWDYRVQVRAARHSHCHSRRHSRRHHSRSRRPLLKSPSPSPSPPPPPPPSPPPPHPQRHWRSGAGVVPRPLEGENHRLLPTHSVTTTSTTTAAGAAIVMPSWTWQHRLARGRLSLEHYAHATCTPHAPITVKERHP